jgi:hypothetical protein
MNHIPLEDRIYDYPDFHELVAESTAEPYPIHGERRIQFVKQRMNALRDALCDADDATAGKILRVLIEGQFQEWESLDAERRAERAELESEL